MQEVEALREAGDAQIAFAQGDQWWHLDIGIQHADYDDGYNQGLGDRPNYFADTRVRQAIAQCIDRQALVEEITWGQGEVMNSFVPGKATQSRTTKPQPMVMIHRRLQFCWRA